MFGTANPLHVKTWLDDSAETSLGDAAPLARATRAMRDISAELLATTVTETHYIVSEMEGLEFWNKHVLCSSNSGSYT